MFHNAFYELNLLQEIMQD